ncbi:hypothetical protein IWW40_003616 [Coemansia sp. RSA 1250]|nr:hypothetical protein IWW40_003616 [Coemansia sp. RSA 1250]
MPSTGPSPLFVPLHPSPRLVAQMTGLSLQQSELEVRQQRNLKRMLRRIRASRKPARSARSSGKLHLIHSRAQMPSLQLPESSVPDSKSDWSDQDDPMVRKMEVTMEILDTPSHEQLLGRVARLINQVFEPETPVASEQVDLQRLSGAMTNCIFMVTLTPPPQQLPAKYLLRVYGTGVDEFLSREKELYWLSQLTSLGFGPQLYGIFGNGRLEEYLESTTLRRDDIRQPSVSKHIARRMSELHALVSYYRPYGRDGEKPELWGNVDSWLRLIRLRKWSSVLSACSANPQCMEILNSWPDLLALIDKLRELVDKANSPIVFAHADLQYGNILRLKDTGELAVVDFEYAGYNYRGFDIANHFCEWMADYHRDSDPHLLNEMDFPTESQRQAFLRTYVKSKAFLDANMRAHADIVENDHTLPDELRAVNLSDERIAADVAAYEREIEPFVAASHLHWGLWGLIQAASSDIDFDYVGYATQRLSIFIRLLK